LMASLFVRLIACMFAWFLVCIITGLGDVWLCDYGIMWFLVRVIFGCVILGLWDCWVVLFDLSIYLQCLPGLCTLVWAMCIMLAYTSTVPHTRSETFVSKSDISETQFWTFLNFSEHLEKFRIAILNFSEQFIKVQNWISELFRIVQKSSDPFILTSANNDCELFRTVQKS
jgi:hypothetical protein